MNKKRPINLDLSRLTYPPMAIVSILHRVSGVLLFLLFPIVLYFLSLSLRSAHTYQDLQILLTHPLYKLVLWVFGSAFGYHLAAGIRHLLMDMGWGEELSSGRMGALFVLGLGIVWAIFLGVCIW